MCSQDFSKNVFQKRSKWPWLETPGQPGTCDLWVCGQPLPPGPTLLFSQMARPAPREGLWWGLSRIATQSSCLQHDAPPTFQWLPSSELFALLVKALSSPPEVFLSGAGLQSAGQFHSVTELQVLQGDGTRTSVPKHLA